MTARPAATLRTDYREFVAVPPRWNDLDIFGHVNNAVFYALFDTAMLRLLTRTGAIGRDAPLAALVVASGAVFHREVLFESEIIVGIRVAQLGRSSVRYELGVFVDDAERSSVDGHATHVFVDRGTRRPVDIPAAVRARYQALQGSQ